MDNGKKILTIILVIAIALGAGFGGGYMGAQFFAKQQAATAAEAAGSAIQQSTQNTQASNVTIQVDGNTTIAEAIAEKVMPSVVGISTVSTMTTSGYGDIFGFWGYGGGQSYSYDATAVGTGVIVDEAGYILTNSHVVNDGDTKSITVSLYDGRSIEGKVLWNDATLDLAVVKIEADGLTAAELGDSDTIKIGSYAAVIGNPLGLQFERSMFEGIISGLNRRITATSEGSGKSTVLEGLIQTDATINSGNSGGPLLNSRGQVIGISSARSSSGESMGFAIPINVAKPIVEQIKETGQFARAYLGIRAIGLSEQGQYNSAQLQENFGTTTGIYVSSVSEGGGAEKAGLKSGDIIISVDGKEVETMNGLNTILVAHRVGDTVEVKYLRDGKTETANVTLSGATIK